MHPRYVHTPKHRYLYIYQSSEASVPHSTFEYTPLYFSSQLDSPSRASSFSTEIGPQCAVLIVLIVAIVPPVPLKPRACWPIHRLVTLPLLLSLLHFHPLPLFATSGCLLGEIHFMGRVFKCHPVPILALCDLGFWVCLSCTGAPLLYAT